MKHSIVAMALTAALALPQSALVQAADTPPATSQSQAVKGYLGIRIGRLPEALRAQLSAAVPQDQGVLVEQVMKGSPAEKAGLQSFDILLKYNDQKLFSPEQLTKLVGADTSGQPATLTVVRGGNISKLQVTLGESQMPESLYPGSRPEMQPLPFHQHHRPPFPGPGQQALENTERNWESFDLLSLEKLKDGQYKAKIGYLAKDGSHKDLEFQGSRDHIRQQILAQKDLPKIERDQLLDALTARDGSFPQGYWPSSVPFEQDFLAPPPWWGWRPEF
jgi:PDZ domain